MTDGKNFKEVKKRNLKREHYNAKQHSSFNSKRKTTSSNLIEGSDAMKGTETEFEEFVIDRTVTSNRKLTINDLEKSEAQNDSSLWRKRLESTLLGFEPTPEELKKAKNPRFKKVCYNCDGEHNVFDCPHPKDHRRIAKKKRETGDEVRRRQEFYNKRLTNQKESNFKPGELSSSARRALGLADNDIPEYVYRMRRLGLIKGYPPGWLKSAIKRTDVLKMFTSETNDSDDRSDVPPELDLAKIVWYPGFNEECSDLNDKEKFKIPPRNVFCDSYQKELVDIHKKQKKQKTAAKKKEKRQKKSKHMKFASEDEDDVIFVKESKASGKHHKFITPGEEDCVLILDGDVKNGESEAPATLHEKEVAYGESLFHTVGTPVLKNHKLADVPSLDAFAAGIQPFEARDEETESKGIFRKLMASLKSVRELSDQNGRLAAGLEASEYSEPPASSVSCMNSEVTEKKRKRKRSKKSKSSCTEDC